MKDSSPKQKRPKQPAENRRLRQENRRLEQENERLRQQNNQLQEQVEQLQRELARPAAPFRRSETQKIGASEHSARGVRWATKALIDRSPIGWTRRWTYP